MSSARPTRGYAMAWFWILVGGRYSCADNVREACEGTLRDLTGVETAFERFRTFVGDSWVVIDSLARYTNRWRSLDRRLV
jgi:ADP-ribose pyrophosphatase YjhB (NUDIX family)